MALRKLNLQNAKTWENLPDVWKVVKRIKPIDLYAGLKKDGIKDKGLLKLVEEFMGKDDLRPLMQGAYFDKQKNVVVSTDAHKMICIPADLDIEQGVYNISPKIAKSIGVSLYSKINGTFPDYKAVLPEHSTIVKVDAYKLKTYSQAVMNGKYTNEYIDKINYKVNDDFMISFNAEFLLQAIDSFLLMGHTELYFGFSTPTRGATISPNENTAKNSVKNIGKHPFALIMPLMLSGSEDLGARDVDYGTSIDVYFSFIDNEIHNADGSIAKYDANLTNTDLPYIDSDSFSLINKLIPKKHNLPFLEYVKIENAKATITDLEFFLQVKDVFVEDGMYEVCNGALKDISDFNIDDFPMMREKGTKLTQIATLQTNEFAQRTKEATMFVSDDDLRPVMECLSLRLEQGNLTKVAGTNGFSLLIADLKGSDVIKKDLKLLVRNPKFLGYFLDVVNDNSVKVFAVNIEDKSIGRLFFETDNYTYSIRLEDGRTPDYEAVIRQSLDTYLEFNTAEMIMAINSLKGEDAKKSLYLDFNREEADGFIKLKLGESKYGDPFNITKDLGIKIPYHIGKSNRQYKNDIAIIMSINTNDDNFAFDPKYLKTVLMVGDKDNARLNFDSKQKTVSMFITEIRPVEESPIKREPVKKVQKVEVVKETPKKATKEEIMIKIEALQILADMGNKDAENNIEILKLLL
jgi:DNA polymerase III sliding clamp (beta) subunit (PCNA family)